MSDIKELKEEELTDEELKKLAGGMNLNPVGHLTCPTCGNNDAFGWIDQDTGNVYNMYCLLCGRGIDN